MTHLQGTVAAVTGAHVLCHEPLSDRGGTSFCLGRLHRCPQCGDVGCDQDGCPKNLVSFFQTRTCRHCGGRQVEWITS